MLLEENMKISEVSEFRFCRIPKIENSEISETFDLLQILRVVIKQDAKMKKSKLRQKLKGQNMLLEEKKKTSEVSGFFFVTFNFNSHLS